MRRIIHFKSRALAGATASAAINPAATAGRNAAF
jgi:hypothetical protein